MNECQNLQHQLDEYLCERLSDFAKRRIDNHLRQCSTCAKEINGYQLAINEFRNLSQKTAIEPSLALQYSLERMVKPVSEIEGLSQSNYVGLILAGIILLGLGTVFGILNYYGAITISLVISSISAIVGMAILGTGLAQMKRRTK